MTNYPVEERTRLKRQRTELAIALAMQSRWEEAIIANRGILDLFPNDVEAHNRLGRALMELGRYQEAKEAYKQALHLDPKNAIAQKNLHRLSQLGKAEAAAVSPLDRLDPQIFIEETGKTGLANLVHLAPHQVLNRMSTGDPVYLKVEGRRLIVENARGEYLGQVEPKLGLRLANLMEGGNRYVAAITSLGEDGGRTVRIFIKETYQDPSQEGRLSFPTKVADGFKPYIKEGLIKHGLEEDLKTAEEDEETIRWEEEQEELGEGIHEEEEEEEEAEDAIEEDEGLD